MRQMFDLHTGFSSGSAMKSITFGTKQEKTQPPDRIQEPEQETQDGNERANGTNKRQLRFHRRRQSQRITKMDER